jgi:hypothetical protein
LSPSLTIAILNENKTRIVFSISFERSNYVLLLETETLLLQSQILSGHRWILTKRGRNAYQSIIIIRSNFDQVRFCQIWRITYPESIFSFKSTSTSIIYFEHWCFDEFTNLIIFVLLKVGIGVHTFYFSNAFFLWSMVWHKHQLTTWSAVSFLQIFFIRRDKRSSNICRYNFFSLVSQRLSFLG